MIAHTTEEYVMSAVMARNNRRAAGRVFTVLSMQQLRDATIQELLEGMFPVWSMPRCYKQDKSSI
jgi:hypothetical protein